MRMWVGAFGNRWLTRCGVAWTNDVGVWCEYKRVGKWLHQVDVFCGVVVNEVGVDQPQCRTVDECVEQILEDYRREVERMKEPPQPPPDPAKELLREYPELGVLALVGGGGVRSGGLG